MSYFEVICPKCGGHYMFGIFGRTIIGNYSEHQQKCQVNKDLSPLGRKPDDPADKKL